MRIITKWIADTEKDWERYETRVFNILAKLSLDELSDLACYRGFDTSFYKDKTSIIKAFMSTMGRMLTDKHFKSLKTK
jgi:hypothetical protein